MARKAASKSQPAKAEKASPKTPSDSSSQVDLEEAITATEVKAGQDALYKKEPFMGHILEGAIQAWLDRTYDRPPGQVNPLTQEPIRCIHGPSTLIRCHYCEVAAFNVALAEHRNAG